MGLNRTIEDDVATKRGWCVRRSNDMDRSNNTNLYRYIMLYIYKIKIMIKFVGCLFSNDMHVFVDMFVQGIPKIRHGKSGRQAHRNSFRWGPLYSDIGLEQLEAVNGMGCLGGYMGAYGMHRYVRTNAYKWILQ